MEITLFLGIGTYNKHFKFMCRQVFIFFITLFIFSCKPSFAALTITDTSPVSISSPDDIITITASASGLQNTTQYLQIGLTKEGESSNYFGFTKNQSEEWFKYKSSPTTSDLSSYFYKFTPVDGVWFGQILAKVDIDDTGYKGAGSYTLKLIKYITSSPSYSSNFATITINISPTPTPTPTNTPTTTSSATPVPTKTPTPSPSKIPSPTQKPTSTPFLLEDKEKLTIDEAFPTSVLGESMESETIDKDKPLKKTPLKEAKVLGVQTDNLSKILIGIGVVLLIGCGILFFRTYMLNKKNGE